MMKTIRSSKYCSVILVLVFVWFGINSMGCFSLHRVPPPGAKSVPMSDQCQGYNSSFLISGAFAAGLGLLSGAGGISTAIPQGTNDQGTRTALGVTSLVLGAGTVVSVFLAQNYARLYSHHCAKDVLVPPSVPAREPIRQDRTDRSDQDQTNNTTDKPRKRRRPGHRRNTNTNDNNTNDNNNNSNTNDNKSDDGVKTPPRFD